MNINHHNYEEYFILYMDNELSNDERRMVEAFVQQQPHLKEELDILLQYKLIPDTSVTYNGKEDLMKVNGDALLTLYNYEEWLVLYMDNELTVGQKVTVDKFLAANPSVKEEFTLLQRTQMRPEEIIFAGKASLYKTEEKVKPMPVRWWRIAAAAVLLLGIGITTAVIINKKSSDAGEIVKNASTEKRVDTKNPVVTPKLSNNIAKENIVANNNKLILAPAVKPGTINNTVARQNRIVRKDEQAVPNILQAKKEEQIIATINKTNNLPKPLENPNFIKNDAAVNSIVNSNVLNEITNSKNPVTNNVVTTHPPQSLDIVKAS